MKIYRIKIGGKALVCTVCGQELFYFKKIKIANAWEDFMPVYRAVHKEYRVNADAMHFYRLRRRLEDIHAFAEGILFDNLPQDGMERSLYYLKRECGLLEAVC